MKHWTSDYWDFVVFAALLVILITCSAANIHPVLIDHCGCAAVRSKNANA
jgi:hypothetical protein